MGNGLEQHFQQMGRLVDQAYAAEPCKIATTATTEDDEVYVTLPESDSPAERVRVSYWQLGVAMDGSNLVPRWPERGKRGVALYLSTGEICLIF